MIYYVQRGDTLYSIAQRFQTTVSAILQANVICNPNLIFIGQLLLIPTPNLTLPKAGGTPYYVVQPGDTLWCLAQQFNSRVQVLSSINQINNPNLIFPGTELLIGPEVPNARELRRTWESTAAQYCDILNPLQIHGVYYIGTYQWQALGRHAIKDLLDLLKNPCTEVRYFAALSLGRIGLNHTVTQALKDLEADPAVASIAQHAIRRIELVQSGQNRVHVTTAASTLFPTPDLTSSPMALPEGSEVIVWKWFIPDPTGASGPKGDIQVYDLVQVVQTGQTGFLPRVEYNETQLV